MLNNAYQAGITVSLTGGGDAVYVLYDYPPLHHSIIACGRTEVVELSFKLKVMSDEEVSIVEDVEITPLHDLVNFRFIF